MYTKTPVTAGSNKAFPQFSQLQQMAAELREVGTALTSSGCATGFPGPLKEASGFLKVNETGFKTY